MTRRNPTSVPDGYFASLQERLLAIPAQESKPRFRAAPYLAFAAAMAALLLIGNLTIREPESGLNDDDIRNYLLASNITVEQLYSVYYEEDY